nr:3-hydroxyacyl-CoA dehydrogenase NAD-binding domain-containing protein [Micromonospora sp. DSM 115978]
MSDVPKGSKVPDVSDVPGLNKMARDREALRIAVIGTGYLGATHAACMAELGFEVRGVDTDPDKVKQLSAGAVPVFEPGLAELVRKHVDDGRLSFHDDLGEVAGWANVHFL